MKNYFSIVASLIGVLLACVASQNATAQDATPNISVNLTNELPTNAIVSVQELFPSAPFTVSVPPSPNPSVSFQGLDDFNTFIPPDTHGAVGLNHVMTMLNTQVRIQNRTGTTNHLTQTLAAWWADAGSFGEVFDPRILYDPYQKRWIAVAVTDRESPASSILIAVSQTDDPTSGWYKHQIDVDAANILWADFPSVGFNKNWIVVSVNMFTNNFSDTYIYAFNKTNLYTNGTNHTRITAKSTGSPQTFTIVPAMTYDTNEAAMYFLQTYAPSNASGGITNGYLRIYTLAGNFGSEVLAATAMFPRTDPWIHSPATVNFAPQTNLSVKIVCGDSRMQNVIYRNGFLWGAHTVFLPVNNPTRSAVQVWQIGTNGAVYQARCLEDASGTMFYAFPSIAVNRFGDMLLGYSTFSTNQYASAAYSYQAYGDARNTLRPGVVLKAGEGRYYKTGSGSANRWGDYSATVIDPINDGDFWTLQEYAATNVGTGAINGDGRWGVWWGNISVGMPTNDNFSASTLLTGSEVFQPGVIMRATAEPGEPSHVWLSNAPSVWYHWVAPTNGDVIVDIQSNSFESALSAYTGSSVTNLQLLASSYTIGSWPSKLMFTAAAGMTYRLAVVSVSGSGSNFTVHLVPPAAPVFVTQPKSTNVVVGETVTLAAAVAGSPPPIFQWQFQGTNLPSATTNSFTRVNVQTNDEGNYWLIASNAFGAFTSATATMLVFTNAKATMSEYGIVTNTYQFYVSGLTNRTYVVEASTNMLQSSNWLSQLTNISPYIYIDMDFTNFWYRSYRVKFLP